MFLFAAAACVEWHDDRPRELSRRCRVSREAMLIRMVDLGKPSRTFYQRKKQLRDAECDAPAQREQVRSGDGTTAG